ncbi:hydrogenase assembly protein HupF [bacterium J17]|nr:hydrogenase assembly protein HupF [bacterium J17]
MCLGVPGEIVNIIDESQLTRRGMVSFGGVLKEINLSFVPEAVPGDYVVVHVGFAISAIDSEEAARVFEHLEKMDQLDE